MSERMDLIRRAFQGLVEQMVDLLPRLAVAFFLVAAGIGLAFLVQALVRAVLRRSGLDRLSEQTGLGRFLSRLGYANPASHLAAFVVFWTVLALTLLTGADALGLPAVSQMIGRLLAQLPPIALAVLVLVIGLSTARTVRRTVEGVAERSRMMSGRLLGSAGYYLVAALATVVALSGLGIDFTIVTVVVFATLASIGVGLAVIIGLGSRDVSRNTISGIYARRDVRVGDRIRVEDIDGEIEAVGQVSLTLRNGSRTWLVPYDRVVTSVVEVLSRAPRPEAADAAPPED
jgi:small-conductance mechanosensitive channel